MKDKKIDSGETQVLKYQEELMHKHPLFALEFVDIVSKALNDIEDSLNRVDGNGKTRLENLADNVVGPDTNDDKKMMMLWLGLRIKDKMMQRAVKEHKKIMKNRINGRPLFLMSDYNE